jgi:ribosomal protein L15
MHMSHSFAYALKCVKFEQFFTRFVVHLKNKLVFLLWLKTCLCSQSCRKALGEGSCQEVVNVSQLNAKFEDGATVNEQSLRETGLVNGRHDAIKILGNGELERALTVAVDAVSASAREKIEKAGGSIAASA